MNDNMITWNIRNWVTVFLMFIAAWAAFGFVVRIVKGGRKSAPLDAAETTDVFGAGVA